MKKILLFSVFSIFGLSALAQPIMQSSDYYPSIGESFILNHSDYVSPGSTGNQVTWDLSAMTSNSTTTVKILAPNPAFTGSTHNMEYVGQSNVHCNFTANEFLVVGEVVGAAVIKYTDSKKMYQFPMTMGTTFTDNFGGTTLSGGVTYIRSGSTESEVDGYGTLITPAGTFNNVIRVHTEQTSTDEYMGQSATSSIEMYTWYIAGTHFELANVTTVSLPFTQQQSASYLDGTSGLANNSSNHPLVLYPNPAQDIITLKYDLEVDNVEVYDLNGRSITVNFDASNNTIDISNLNSGIYYVTVYSNNSKSVQKLLKK